MLPLLLRLLIEVHIVMQNFRLMPKCLFDEYG
jgi:hypothetical protein